MPIFVTDGSRTPATAKELHERAEDLDFEAKYELYKAAVRVLYQNCVEVFGEDITKRCIARMNKEAANQ